MAINCVCPAPETRLAKPPRKCTLEKLYPESMDSRGVSCRLKLRLFRNSLLSLEPLPPRTSCRHKSRFSKRRRALFSQKTRVRVKLPEREESSNGAVRFNPESPLESLLPSAKSPAHCHCFQMSETPRLRPS